MNLDFVKVSPDDEKAVWRVFPGSPQQAVLHNELVKAIQEDRAKLEQCSQDELLFLQARLAARRDLLGVIHRRDAANQPNPN